MYEEWSVLTYRDYNFEDNGRQVRGRTLHCYRKNSGDGWPGIEYAKMAVPFGSEAYAVIPKLNTVYQLSFDRRGKIVNRVESEPSK